MTDGMLDLLSAVLVLGIVVSIAFGFILPLVDNNYMNFDAQYEDKGALNNIIDYGNPDEYENLTKRMYTYEELMLLLAVQDSKMSGSNTINFRNLITTVDLGYSGYSSEYPGNGKTNNLDNRTRDINTYMDDNATRRLELRYDEVFQAFIRWGDNGWSTIDDDEQSKLEGLRTTDPNIVAITIDDSFGVSNKPLITELNGSEVNNVDLLESGNITLASHEKQNTRLSVFNDIISPLDNMDRYNKRKVYYVSYHFALPFDDTEDMPKSKYLDSNKNNLMAQYYRLDVLKPMYFIEIEGDNLTYRKSNYNYSDYSGSFELSLNESTYPAMSLDTWSEYQNYLKQLRKDVNYGL